MACCTPIIPLFSSFPDLLAFAATCHPWRSAFSSYPSKSTLYTLFPPLLLEPDVPFCSPRPLPNAARNAFIPKRPCYVTDLASQDKSLCSQIPVLSNEHGYCQPGVLFKFAFTGASFGHMIYSNNRSCFLFDVFIGIDVSTPLLPIDDSTEIYAAALTGPLASPNSHLIVSTMSSNFFWRVGSSSWLKLSPGPGAPRITKFVIFKGQVFGMSSERMLFMVHLTPQIHLQEMPVSWGGKNSMTKWHLSNPWLVACGDMLLMVGCPRYPGTGDVFEAYRLDTTTEPAKWVNVEKLENWAIFISEDERVQPLSCMNPERWGGRSNCVYRYGSGHWVDFEFSKRKPPHGDATEPCMVMLYCAIMVQPIWVVPSMLSVVL